MGLRGGAPESLKLVEDEEVLVSFQIPEKCMPARPPVRTNVSHPVRGNRLRFHTARNCPMQFVFGKIERFTGEDLTDHRLVDSEHGEWINTDSELLPELGRASEVLVLRLEKMEEPDPQARWEDQPIIISVRVLPQLVGEPLVRIYSRKGITRRGLSEEMRRRTWTSYHRHRVYDVEAGEYLDTRKSFERGIRQADLIWRIRLEPSISGGAKRKRTPQGRRRREASNQRAPPHARGGEEPRTDPLCHSAGGDVAATTRNGQGASST